MSHLARRLFLNHPASVGESYLQHMAFAARIGFWLMLAAVCAFLHALVPALCEKTASTIIRRLHGRTESRGPQASSRSR